MALSLSLRFLPNESVVCSLTVASRLALGSWNVPNVTVEGVGLEEDDFDGLQPS